MKQLFSIVIPVFNSANTIEECLESIFNLKYPQNLFDVIVVDGGSKDNTLGIINKFPVKLLTGGGLPAKSRNIGIKHANDIVAFTDSDCVVREDWLSNIVKHFDDPQIAGVGGPNLTPKDDPFFARCVGALMESFLGSAGVRNTVIHKNVQEVKHNPPVNAAVRRSVLEEVGGFETSFTISEDVELDAKIREMGYKLIYDPEIVVYHHRRGTLTGFVKQLVGYGRGRASAFIRFPGSLPLTYFCVGFFLLGLIFSVPLYMLSEFLRPIIFYGWVIYLLFIVISSLYLITVNRSWYLIILPFLAFIEHLSLGFGFVLGLIKPYR